MILVFISLMTTGVKNVFVYLLAIYISSFVNPCSHLTHIYLCCLSFSKKIIYLFIYLERGREGEREEKNINVREKH